MYHSAGLFSMNTWMSIGPEYPFLEETRVVVRINALGEYPAIPPNAHLVNKYSSIPMNVGKNMPSLGNPV